MWEEFRKKKHSKRARKEAYLERFADVHLWVSAFPNIWVDFLLSKHSGNAPGDGNFFRPSISGGRKKMRRGS